ncbi:MAG: flagellar biosynthesis protein FlhB [Burkholderiales bacterium]
MAEQEKDRTEPATPFKLEEARRRGQVAKSLDFISLVMLGSLLAALYAWSDRLAAAGLRVSVGALERAGGLSFGSADAAAWLGQFVGATLAMLAPFLAVAVLAAIVANLIQTGPVFSAFPLKPDFQRINPASGFKRVFSLKTLVETGKTLVKLAAFGGVAWLALDAALPKLLTTVEVPPKAYFGLLLGEITALMFKLLLVLVLLALIDLAYSRWDYGRTMRMSRREMKEEVKRREGDPHVRARIRELQREAVKRAKSAKRLPEADVLITNPEHFAVALAYDRGRMRAPTVVAKGAGELALELRRRAAPLALPIVEDNPLARRLFAEVELDCPIGEALFEPVARVYASLYQAKKTAAQLEVRA